MSLLLKAGTSTMVTTGAALGRPGVGESRKKEPAMAFHVQIALRVHTDRATGGEVKAGLAAKVLRPASTGGEDSARQAPRFEQVADA